MSKNALILTIKTAFWTRKRRCIRISHRQCRTTPFSGSFVHKTNNNSLGNRQFRVKTHQNASFCANARSFSAQKGRKTAPRAILVREFGFSTVSLPRKLILSPQNELFRGFYGRFLKKQAQKQAQKQARIKGSRISKNRQKQAVLDS